MRVRTYADRLTMSRAAAQNAAATLRACIRTNGDVRLIAATGSSQLDFLEALTDASDIDWSRVELFHLDEYVGLSVNHEASFRRYLLDRLINKVSVGRYHLLDGEQDPLKVADEVGRALAERTVDLAFVGVGENAHLAFNDPPADFDTEQPYVIAMLDTACRRQQVGEGWFRSIEEVPAHAITMSVRQILKSTEIVAVVPDARKADAVKACLEGPVSPMAPASILQTHPNTTLFLDSNSASKLAPAVRNPSS
ncbi:MAG: glucosamine-6-phosphate deaminase [Vicinamibacterales bacterium]